MAQTRLQSLKKREEGGRKPEENLISTLVNELSTGTAMLYKQPADQFEEKIPK